MCAWRVLVTLILNVEILDWHIRGFRNVLVFREVYINFVEVGDGDIKMVAQINVHDTFSRHSCMIIGHVLMDKYPY